MEHTATPHRAPLSAARRRANQAKQMTGPAEPNRGLVTVLHIGLAIGVLAMTWAALGW